MIKHIVMWRLKEDKECNNKADKALEIKNKIEALKEKIDAIVDLEIGVNFEKSNQSYDLVLYSVFESKEDLNTYQNHEEHLKVVKSIKDFIESRVVVDYEV